MVISKNYKKISRVIINAKCHKVEGPILPLSRRIVHTQQQVTSGTRILATVTFHVGSGPTRSGTSLTQLNLLHMEVIIGLTSPLFLHDRIQKLIPTRFGLFLARGRAWGCGGRVIGPGGLGSLHHSMLAHFAPQFFVLCTFGHRWRWCWGWVRCLVRCIWTILDLWILVNILMDFLAIWPLDDV